MGILRTVHIQFIIIYRLLVAMISAQRFLLLEVRIKYDHSERVATFPNIISFFGQIFKESTEISRYGLFVYMRKQSQNENLISLFTKNYKQLDYNRII